MSDRIDSGCIIFPIFFIIFVIIILRATIDDNKREKADMEKLHNEWVSDCKFLYSQARNGHDTLLVDLHNECATLRYQNVQTH